MVKESISHSLSLACRGWRIGIIVVITLLLASQPSDARVRVKIWLPIPVIKTIMDNHSRSRTVEPTTKKVRGGKKASRSVASDGHASEAKARSSSGATEGSAPYPTGKANDFYGPMGPRIRKVPGRSLAFSYAAQGYFNRAQVCVAHGDGTNQDITEGKAAYKRANTVKRSQQVLPDASQRERQSDYADKPAESKTRSRNTFNDAIDRYNLMELEYNEGLVRQKKIAAAAGDDEARQWLRENEWRVKLVRSMYDATHPKQ